MILKGNQRAGGRQMALHLLNGEENEHVNVYEIRGFIASDVLGAFNEAYALSKGTQCKQYLYSLSLNPPQSEHVSIEIFEKALDRVEKKLRLEEQPRVLVFHEKEGRRHAHAVWSRIDIEEMKAINIAFPKQKLNEIAKSLYLEHGWKMPEGFRDKSRKNPLNYTRAEWQQAARIGRKPADIKRELQESWAISDSKQSFINALQEQGYTLARGDRRGYVVVDIYGEIYALPRQIGVKKKDIEQRLGKSETLPSVDQAKETITAQIKKLFQGFLDEQNKEHQKNSAPFLKTKHEMIKQHRLERSAQKSSHESRWEEEQNKRAAKIRTGFKGIWDKLIGTYWKQRKANEKEAWRCYQRDQKEQQALIDKQLIQRKPAKRIEPTARKT